jgi:hypothetical protein
MQVQGDGILDHCSLAREGARPAVSGEGSAAVGGSAAQSGFHLARTHCLFMFVYDNETCESCAFAYSYDLGARQNKIAGLRGSGSGGRLRRRLWLAVDAFFFIARL